MSDERVAIVAVNTQLLLLFANTVRTVHGMWSPLVVLAVNAPCTSKVAELIAKMPNVDVPPGMNTFTRDLMGQAAVPIWKVPLMLML